MRRFKGMAMVAAIFSLSACDAGQQEGAARGAVVGGVVTTIMGGDKTDIVRGTAVGAVIGGISN